jgi:hypothetical protein
MACQYASNEKSSRNEEGASHYVRTQLHQAVGSPPSENDARSHHGDGICDGMGTRIDFIVLEITVKLGLKVVLRVPHLSFRLIDEDIVNFFMLKAKLSPHHILWR